MHFTDKEKEGRLVRVGFTFTPLVSRLGRGRDGKSRRSALALLILFTTLLSAGRSWALGWNEDMHKHR